LGCLPLSLEETATGQVSVDKDDLLKTGSMDPLEPEQRPTKFFFEFSAALVALVLLFMASQTK